MAVTSKIRVGIVGLNAPYAGTPTGTSWAAIAHLPYLKSSDKYELVALQNSTAERAAKAIEAYGLNPDTKAYGTPEELASDPNVDLVVTSTRVDKHAAALIPSIKAKKAVYVEWPIEANYAIAKELTDLVKTHKVRNVVGLQGSLAPVIKTVKALMDAGEVGKVDSSTMILTNVSGPSITSEVGYFIDKKVGGNPFTIGFGHSMESIREVLGEVASHTSLLVNQYPTVDILDPTTRAVTLPAQPKDVPNQIVFNAVMKSGAVFTYKLHNAATPSPGAQPRSDKRRTPSLDWRIFGRKAEVRVTSYGTWNLAGSRDVTVEICRADDGVLEEIEILKDEFEELPLLSRNIARVYEAFAASWDGRTESEKGNKENPWYADFEYALDKHELIDKMYRENGF